MAALTVRTVSETDIDVAVGAGLEDADSGAGDTAANPNGDVMLYMENPGASSATVTVTAQNTPKNISGHGPLTKANLAITMAAGAKRMVGPLNDQMWNDGSGNVNISYSGAGAADVDIMAFRGPKA